MNTGLDLDAYFARIGYNGPREPTLETLHAISLHHTTSIPFENLDVLLGRPIQLTQQVLAGKLIHARRGGYCFEQNNLLLQVLRALGFRASLLGARVRGPIPRTETPVRTHTFVKVTLPAGDFLADVGLGSSSLTSAIPLEFDRELPTVHETRRLTRDGTRLFHEVRQGDGWMDVCEFTLDEFHFVDCEVANWWTSAHERSHFRQNLVVGLARRDGTRVGIREGKFLHRRGADILSAVPITSAEQLRGLLRDEFGLEFPAGTRFGPPGSPWS